MGVRVDVQNILRGVFANMPPRPLKRAGGSRTVYRSDAREEENGEYGRRARTDPYRSLLGTS
jgi:hypothetical protein